MSNDDHTPPILTIDGFRATIRLNRPKAMNRIEPDDLLALVALFDRVEADRDVRVLVLTGTGRAFSAGFDLRAVGGQATAAGPSFSEVADRLEALRMPTICRLNGGVYGGSTDLALACDFRIGVDTCELVMPAAKLGLHYYRSGLERFVARIGLSNAKMLFLTARKLEASELLRIGYLDEIVPASELDARVNALAESLSAHAPNAVAGMKASLNAISRGVYDASAIDARHRASLSSDELKEGSAAFREKRPPRFQQRDKSY